MGARIHHLGLVLVVALGFTSCDDEGVTLDVGAPVDSPVRPARELAYWSPAEDIGVVRIGERGRGRRRLLRIGDVRRFFVDRVSWSSDGRRLAFTGESGLGYRGIDVLAVDGNGGGVRGVTRTGDALWPVWAPDGRSIVYARVGDLTPDGAPDYTSSLWAIDPEGGTPRRLTDPAEGISERPWSFAPDGSRLAITRARLPALERRAEKTRLVLLVVRRHDARLHPRTAIQNAEVYSIWHVNPDGTCPEALLAGRPRGNWYASPVWSPGRPTRRPKRLRC